MDIAEILTLDRVIPSLRASDKAQLRAKGMQSYGIGPGTTREDGENFGAHSDVERMPESSLYPFVAFTWNVVSEIAVHK